MNKYSFKFYAFICCLILAIGTASAQSVNPQNLSNVKVNELSDAQIKAFIKQVESTGLSEAQLEQVALARGMSQEEVQKLRLRVDKIKKEEAARPSNAAASKTEGASSRQITDPGAIDAPMLKESTESKADMALAELRSKIFGAALFKNAKMSFEPNLRIATPSNYVLGPDDEVRLELTGYNEASYKLPVSPEGTIRVEYAGLISVSGLTVEQAVTRIKSRLSKYYPAISTGATQVNVALGNIRSIKVTVLGEAVKPGSFTLPSLATAFNALYAAGGPSENGSLRQIEIIRNNKIIRKLDVYDFLLRGDQANNIRLQDQDIIRIPPYQQRVEFLGEVKRPAIFEMLNGESLAQLIDFAGGFTESAYTARVKVLQNTDKERRMNDVAAADFKNYQPQMGDKFYVEPILERFENRVSIKGAVFRPGEYALTQGLSMSQLLQKAEGLTEDAFTQRAYLTRLKADNTFELIAFDLNKVLNGGPDDILLKREDQIQIASIFDLRDAYKITIDGAVRTPGELKFAENMALEDAIIQAGGFTESGFAKRIEVARRVKNQDDAISSKTAEIFQIDVDPQLKFSKTQFSLQPFDIISVRNAPGFEEQRQVVLKGEVKYPGAYALSRKDERISDIIARAGGLSELAYPQGASLKRPGNQATAKKDKFDADEDVANKLSLQKRLQKKLNDTTQVDLAEEKALNLAVGIQLAKILNRPGSSLDLILEAGDTISVPKKLQTVKVGGEVLSPITVVYRSGKSLKTYISEAGGTSENAMIKRAYVIQANGSVKSTRRLFLFNFYPNVGPGAEIFVPAKAQRAKLSPQELLGITSGIASLGAVILGIINLTK